MIQLPILEGVFGLGYFFGFITVLILSFLYPSIEPTLFVLTGIIAVAATVVFVANVRASSPSNEDRCSQESG